VIVAAGRVDSGVVGVAVAVLAVLAASAWKAAALRSDLISDWSQRIDLAKAGLEERAVEVLVEIQVQISAVVLRPGEPFDPARAIADPAGLRSHVDKYIAVMDARDGLRTRLRAILKVGPVLFWLLVAEIVVVAVCSSYYCGFHRERMVGQMSMLIALLIAILLAATFARFAINLNRLSRAEILAAGLA
jgi:hypothetical protein